MLCSLPRVLRSNSASAAQVLDLTMRNSREDCVVGPRRSESVLWSLLRIRVPFISATWDPPSAPHHSAPALLAITMFGGSSKFSVTLSSTDLTLTSRYRVDTGPLSLGEKDLLQAVGPALEHQVCELDTLFTRLRVTHLQHNERSNSSGVSPWSPSGPERCPAMAADGGAR